MPDHDPPACRAQVLILDVADHTLAHLTCMAQPHNHPPHAAFFGGKSLPANKLVWVTISWHDVDP
jgi:hypothetical protein